MQSHSECVGDSQVKMATARVCLLLLAAILASLATANAQCLGSYTVKPGDYLYNIAVDIGVRWEDLFLANWDQISDPSMISPGMALRIPPCNRRFFPSGVVGSSQNSPSPSPPPPSPSSGGRCNNAYVGDATYYHVNSGATACGEYFNDDEMVAAISWRIFDRSTGNPNTSRSCHMCAEVCGPAGTAVVRIKDKCGGCLSGDIDLSPLAFKLVVGDLGIGRQPGVRWNYVPC